MVYMKNIQHNRWIVLSLSLITFVIVGGIAHAWFEAWTRIQSDTSGIYTSDAYVCYMATNNNTSNDVFVPNNTQEEIDAFTNYYPSSYISLSTGYLPVCSPTAAWHCTAWTPVDTQSSSCIPYYAGDTCIYYTWNCQTQCWTVTGGCNYTDEY